MSYCHNKDNRLEKLVKEVIYTRGEHLPSAKVSLYLKKYQFENQVIIDKAYSEAVKKLFASNLLILSGGPGTGKKECIKLIAEIFEKNIPETRVIITSTEKLHSQFSNNNIKLNAGLLIVPDANNLDVSLVQNILNSISPGTKVLLVGDVNLLSSTGNILKQLIKLGTPSVNLYKINPKSVHSLITINAHRILRGHSITLGKDFVFIKKSSDETIQRLVSVLIDRGYDKRNIYMADLSRLPNDNKKYPVVIIPLSEPLTRERLYTVITRSEDKVYIIGNYEQLDKARSTPEPDRLPQNAGKILYFRR